MARIMIMCSALLAAALINGCTGVTSARNPNTTPASNGTPASPPAPGVSSPTCGSTAMNIVLPVNYEPEQTPPPIGAYYKGQFRCNALRIANGVHEYSVMAAFSQNDTYFVAFACVDSSGADVLCPGAFTETRIYRTADGGVECKLPGLGSSNEVRWDRFTDSRFWYHEGNQLFTGDASQQRPGDPTSCTSGTLYDTITRYQAISFGGGSDDISDDGDHFFIANSYPSAGVYGGALYTISSKTLGTELNGGKIGQHIWAKNGHVLSNNNIEVIFSSPPNVGTEIYNGFSGTFLRDVTPGWYPSHDASGKDADGGPILATNTANDPNPATDCVTNFSIEKINLNTGLKTCIMPNGNTTLGGHYSINNQGAARFNVLISADSDGYSALPWSSYAQWQSSHAYMAGDYVVPTTDNKEFYRALSSGTSGSTQPVFLTDNSNTPDGQISWQMVGPTLSPSWQTGWNVYTNELILVPFDASATTRVIQTMTRDTALYNNGARATISRSGKYVLMDSNFGIDAAPSGGSTGGGWSVYLVRLW